MEEDWKVMDESMIIEAAKDPEAGEDNNFYKILLAGEVYKNADLTPIYLYNMDKGTLKVIAEELIGETLH